MMEIDGCGDPYAGSKVDEPLGFGLFDFPAGGLDGDETASIAEVKCDVEASMED